MKLTDVSKTAVATLRSHVIESKGKNPIMNDPMAVYCLEKMLSLFSDRDRALLLDRKLLSSLTSHIALRARKYDSIVNDFIRNNPAPVVVNLGCGFDTRFWRIDNEKCRYLELDLPEVIELKKKILKEHLNYELIGCSVLDVSWIDKITAISDQHVILIAEGLFMYLEKGAVINLINKIADSFRNSRLVLEVVTEKYTRGLWKKIVAMKIKRALGLDAGSYYNFGVGDAHEMESYGKGIKIIDEWSYVEDDDIRPAILKLFKNSRTFTKTQWTVTAALNA